MLIDYLAALLAVPTSDSEVVEVLMAWPDRKRLQSLQSWLGSARAAHPRLVCKEREVAERFLAIEMTSPYSAIIGFFILGAPMSPEAHLNEVSAKFRTAGLDAAVLVVCGSPDFRDVDKFVGELRRAIEPGQRILVMEPSWAAALLVEQLTPLLGSLGVHGVGGPAYFLTEFEDAESERSAFGGSARLLPLRGGFIEDRGSYAEKIRDLQAAPFYEGSILLCTTFLPSISQSPQAVRRFYELYGATPETLALVDERIEWEWREWIAHVEQHKRIDIVDKSQLEEYFGAPEYYQMLLTREELQEQIERLSKLLEFPNYTLCLTEEAVAISYELRGDQVLIRPDRRNRGRPRAGRLNGVMLKSSEMREAFEREFWTLFRSTPAEFKEKESVRSWLEEQASAYEGAVSQADRAQGFDVFICYRSNDRGIARELADRLREEGLRPWIDFEQLIPGIPWQRSLEAQIATIRSAAVLIGEGGLGPWMNFEIEAFLHEFVSRRCPIIPVVLPTVDEAGLDLPIFLNTLHRVDMRKAGDADPIKSLVRGIRAARHH